MATSHHDSRFKIHDITPAPQLAPSPQERDFVVPWLNLEPRDTCEMRPVHPGIAALHMFAGVDASCHTHIVRVQSSTLPFWFFSFLNQPLSHMKSYFCFAR